MVTTRSSAWSLSFIIVNIIYYVSTIHCVIFPICINYCKPEPLRFSYLYSHGYGTLNHTASSTASILASALAPYPLSSGLSVKTPAAVRTADMPHITVIANITCNNTTSRLTFKWNKNVYWNEPLSCGQSGTYLFEGKGIITGKTSKKGYRVIVHPSFPE